MQSSKSALLALATLMASAGVIAPANVQVAPTGNTASQTNAVSKSDAQGQKAGERHKATKGLLSGAAWRVGRRTFPGGGWSVRQGQRMARKARNQQRYKAATRG